MTGLTDVPISRYETGKREPSLSDLARIAAVLQIPAVELLDNTVFSCEAFGDGKTAAHLSHPRKTRERQPVLIDGIVEIPALSISACMGRKFDNNDNSFGDAEKIYLWSKQVGVAAPVRPFGVRCEGSGMSPLIEDGEIAIVDPNVPLVHGNSCFAAIWRVMMVGNYRMC